MDAVDLPEMTVEECWEMLRAHEFGRLAFAVIDEQHITPVNYAVDGIGTDSTLLFRTAPGTKLFAVELGGEVAFEIDAFDDESAASVVVRGPARRLPEDEAHRAESLPLRPWIGGARFDVVEIVPTAVTGRRFDLTRPWLSLRLDA